MSSILQRVFGFLTARSETTQDRDEKYLAESSDIYDLERRMRQVDSGRHNLYSIGAYGVFMR